MISESGKMRKIEQNSQNCIRHYQKPGNCKTWNKIHKIAEMADTKKRKTAKNVERLRKIE